MDPPSDESPANLRPRSPTLQASSPPTGTPVPPVFLLPHHLPTLSDTDFFNRRLILLPTTIPPPPGLYNNPPEHLVRRSSWPIPPGLLASASPTSTLGFSGFAFSGSSPFGLHRRTPISPINSLSPHDSGATNPAVNGTHPVNGINGTHPANRINGTHPVNGINTHPVRQPSYSSDYMQSSSSAASVTSNPTSRLIRHLDGVEIHLGEWIVIITSDHIQLFIELEPPHIIGDDNTFELHFKVMMLPRQGTAVDVVLGTVRTPGRRGVAGIRSLFKHQVTQPKRWSLAIILSHDLDPFQNPGDPVWAFGWDLEPIWHNFTDETLCYATLLFFYHVWRPVDFPGFAFINDPDLQPLRVHRPYGQEILDDAVLNKESEGIMNRLGYVAYRQPD
ncbi:hypothetical protein K505DRAFT_365220 [Melanomma pulvis-pyrius CBS 109.77]|uniref:Uncharacterized protein n=1 Tax=Melanomma pulvis-pyrius CBS 109.77 TaxID=1314802 RepID=A0A6A6X1U5_9PLEO|nr:hypothetical protein K505DRAFT_365220 [Melanomma pulvis-pyrius CBS 109.77]